MNQLDLKQIKEVIDESLQAQERRLDKKFATKDDLKQFATKEDLNNAVEDLGKLITDFADRLDEKKAEKEDLNDVEKRVTQLEHKIVT
jgi:hypothetical protein